MANERIRRLLEAVMREVAGGEHDRLKADLNEWAMAQGYPDAINGFPADGFPMCCDTIRP